MKRFFSMLMTLLVLTVAMLLLVGCNFSPSTPTPEDKSYVYSFTMNGVTYTYTLTDKGDASLSDVLTLQYGSTSVEFPLNSPSDIEGGKRFSLSGGAVSLITNDATGKFSVEEVTGEAIGLVLPPSVFAGTYAIYPVDQNGEEQETLGDLTVNADGTAVLIGQTATCIPYNGNLLIVQRSNNTRAEVVRLANGKAYAEGYATGEVFFDTDADETYAPDFRFFPYLDSALNVYGNKAILTHRVTDTENNAVFKHYFFCEMQKDGRTVTLTMRAGDTSATQVLSLCGDENRHFDFEIVNTLTVQNDDINREMRFYADGTAILCDLFTGDKRTLTVMEKEGDLILGYEKVEDVYYTYHFNASTLGLEKLFFGEEPANLDDAVCLDSGEYYDPVNGFYYPSNSGEDAEYKEYLMLKAHRNANDPRLFYYVSPGFTMKEFAFFYGNKIYKLYGYYGEDGIETYRFMSALYTGAVTPENDRVFAISDTRILIVTDAGGAFLLNTEERSIAASYKMIPFAPDSRLYKVSTAENETTMGYLDPNGNLYTMYLENYDHVTFEMISQVYTEVERPSDYTVSEFTVENSEDQTYVQLLTYDCTNGGTTEKHAILINYTLQYGDQMIIHHAAFGLYSVSEEMDSGCHTVHCGDTVYLLTYSLSAKDVITGFSVTYP